MVIIVDYFNSLSMKFFKAALLVFAAIVMANSANGQALYSKVKIEVNSLEEAKKLNGLGVAVDHGIWKKNWFETDLSADEITTVRNAGFTCQVIIEDVKAYYVARNKDKSTTPGSPTNQNNGCTTGSEPAVPSGFALGSMGGYYTYQEFIAAIDTMAARYPNLITAKAPISNYQTVGGRSIYWVKISDNPNVDENEPEVMYTALHHAREPLSLSQLMFYMYFLLENYNINPNVKYAVDNTEMYFVPMVNPDGYVYNQTTDPNGGGMWRKNRRNNGNNVYGVDPNRNYSYEWGTTGTSTNTSDETYCGTAPFSEVETQAMKYFVVNHHFVVAQNYHTYGNLLLFPWGYTQSIQCVDNDLLEAMANDFATTTELFVEQSSTLYEASGDSDDWAYGDTLSKPKVFAMTPELGNDADGFWPQETRIIPVSKEQVGMNLKVAYVAGNYGVASDNTPSVLSTTTGYFKYSLQRLGLQQGSFTVSITPLSNIQSVGSANTHSGLTYGQTVADSISYTLLPTVIDGDHVQFLLEVNNGLVTMRDTITKLFGNANIVFSNSGAPANQFTTTGTWGLSNSTYFSGPNSWADSPNGNYSNNSTATMKTAQVIDLDTATYAYLHFKAKWNIEAAYDYAQVSASVDGQTWTPLCGKYTHPGSVNQDADMPVYDGIQSGWVDEEIDLSAYAGLQIYLRFLRKSDQGVNADGIFVDDIMVDIVKAAIPNGIAEELANGVKLYPNPANNVLYLASTQTVSYTVFDVVGKNLLSGNSTGTSQVDIATLSKGIYFIRITSNGAQTVKRFVKE